MILTEMTKNSNIYFEKNNWTVIEQWCVFTEKRSSVQNAIKKIRKKDKKKKKKVNFYLKFSEKH